MHANSTSRTLSSHSWLSNPVAVVALASAACASWALYAALRFPPEKAALNLVYHVPIVFPFVSFILERFPSIRWPFALSLLPDALVVTLAMWRIIGDVPYVSGHALFLTYAIATSRTRLTRIAAVLVLVETLWLKLFAWHDYTTLVAGIAVGLCFALASAWLRFREAASTVSTRQPN